MNQDERWSRVNRGYRPPLATMQCVECGADRPQFSARCPCGSVCVAQAEPVMDQISLDHASIYGPVSSVCDAKRYAREHKRRHSKALKLMAQRQRAIEQAEALEAYKLGVVRQDYGIFAPPERKQVADANALQANGYNDNGTHR